VQNPPEAPRIDKAKFYQYVLQIIRILHRPIVVSIAGIAAQHIAGNFLLIASAARKKGSFFSAHRLKPILIHVFRFVFALVAVLLLLVLVPVAVIVFAVAILLVLLILPRKLVVE